MNTARPHENRGLWVIALAIAGCSGAPTTPTPPTSTRTIAARLGVADPVVVMPPSCGAHEAAWRAGRAQLLDGDRHLAPLPDLAARFKSACDEYRPAPARNDRESINERSCMLPPCAAADSDLVCCERAYRDAAYIVLRAAEQQAPASGERCWVDLDLGKQLGALPCLRQTLTVCGPEMSARTVELPGCADLGFASVFSPVDDIKRHSYREGEVELPDFLKDPPQD